MIYNLNKLHELKEILLKKENTGGMKSIYRVFKLRLFVV